MDSKQLKKIRLSMGLNQAEMSKLVGINRRTYKSYELGERLITEDFKRLIYEINNTGLKNSFYLDGKIDYLRIRFQTFDWKTIIDDVLKLEDKPFESNASSRYGYDFYYVLRFIHVVARICSCFLSSNSNCWMAVSDYGIWNVSNFCLL